EVHAVRRRFGDLLTGHGVKEIGGAPVARHPATLHEILEPARLAPRHSDESWGRRCRRHESLENLWSLTRARESSPYPGRRPCPSCTGRSVRRAPRALSPP